MLAKRELLFNKQISSLSIMHFVDGFFADLESNNERTASVPLSLSMLEKILIILYETRISLSGKLLLFISSINSNKYDVPFDIFGRFDAKDAQMLSINLYKFSIAVLHPVVNNLTVMSGSLV